MPKIKSEFEKASGKLISVIQKEWTKESGLSCEKLSEDVMDLAHIILQMRTPEKAKELLGSMTVRQYLGDLWVQAHPDVKPAILTVQNTLLKK